MYKDILAYLPADERAQAIIDCAVSLALVLGAHLDGVALAGDAAIGESPARADATALELVLQYEAGMSSCARALHRFETAAKKAGIFYSVKAIGDAHIAAAAKLSLSSRLYDLSIVARPEIPGFYRALSEAVLFDSGRPMLIVPPAHRGPLALDRVAICWDGGYPAARAVRDAMPLLYLAKTIDIIAVGEVADAVDCDALAFHLRRHLPSVLIRRQSLSGSDISSAILHALPDCGSRLLVSGGDGHPQYGKFVLGEMTRNIFGGMPIPALISH